MGSAEPVGEGTDEVGNDVAGAELEAAGQLWVKLLPDEISSVPTCLV